MANDKFEAGPCTKCLVASTFGGEEVESAFSFEFRISKGNREIPARWARGGGGTACIGRKKGRVKEACKREQRDPSGAASRRRAS